MKTFAVLDADATGRLVALGHAELIQAICGHAYLPRRVQTQLEEWKGLGREVVRDFGANPPSWVEKRNPSEIHPSVVELLGRPGQEKCLHPGEADAISLAIELARDGSRGVVISDDGDVRKFLNFEQNPERARILAAANLAGEKWHNFGARESVQRPGPGVPENRIAATENQRIFATSSWSILAQGAERGLIKDFGQEVERATSIGLEPSDRVKILNKQASEHFAERQQSLQNDQEHDR